MLNKQIITELIRYFVEGFAVAFVSYFILPKNKKSMKEVAILALISATTLLILDLASPGIAAGARKGAGFGMGLKLTEGFDGEDYKDGCPNTHKAVGEAYIRKYGRRIMARTDINDQQKIDLIFQNMKTHLDNLQPPIQSNRWNDHAYIASRLGLCAGQ